MNGAGAVAFKEFAQAANRRRTHLFRVFLAGVTVLLVAPQLLMAVVRAGQDWRTLAEVCRPVFWVSSWVQMLSLPLLAVLYAQWTLREEWSRGAMEVLWVTPLSRGGIIYGKFACAVGKVFLLALAPMPVVWIWMKLGRIPPLVAWGSIGVTVSAVVFFGAAAFFEAASSAPGARRTRWALVFLFLYLVAATSLGTASWGGRGYFLAAVPHLAFQRISVASAPGGMSLASFVRLAVAVPLAAGALLLAATPLALRASLRRYMGGGKGRTGRRARWSRPAASRRRRPALDPDADPFVWQELGPASAWLRRSAWAVLFLVALVGVVGAALAEDDLFLLDPDWLLVAAHLAIGVVSIAGLCYGCSVFAREKARGTAEALVLTGVGAGTLYRAKLAAALRAMAPAVAGIAVLVGISGVLTGEVTPALGRVLLWALVGPPGAVVLGMAMSAPARSPAQALGGMLLVLLWCILLSWCILVGFVGSAIGTILMLVLVKRWTVFRMSLLMGFVTSLTGWITLLVVMLASLGTSLGPGVLGGASRGLGEWLGSLAILFLGLAHLLVWYFLGTSTFEKGFLGGIGGRGRG